MQTPSSKDVDDLVNNELRRCREYVDLPDDFGPHTNTDNGANADLESVSMAETHDFGSVRGCKGRFQGSSLAQESY